MNPENTFRQFAALTFAGLLVAVLFALLGVDTTILVTSLVIYAVIAVAAGLEENGRKP